MRDEPIQASPERAGLPVLKFADEAAMAGWLGREPGPAGVWIQFPRKSAGWAGLNRKQALDVALCLGWIDGQAAPFDEESFLMRFTPRRAKSLWSKINCARVEQLTAEGRMRDKGLRQVALAKADGRWSAAYDSPRTIQIPQELADLLAASPGAEAAFGGLSKSMRYRLLLDIATKKKAETRTRKIRDLVATLTSSGGASTGP